MPDTYSYVAPQRATSLALDDARGLLLSGNEAADHAVRMIRHLRAAGCPGRSIDMLKDALTDAFGDTQGGITRILDEQRLADDCHQIELTELERA